MNISETNTPTDDFKQECVLPRHPLFDTDEEQASFTDCVDAIDRVRSIIALYDFLELGEDRGGLSSDAAFGCYWINVMNRGTLSYVSDRLMDLDRQNRERRKHESGYLSALFGSLHTLGRDNRERFLNNTAAQMNITRSAVDQFVRKKTKQ